MNAARDWVVMTGGAGGIARAAAPILLREDYDLLLIDRPGSDVENWANTLSVSSDAAGREILASSVDTGSPAGFEAALAGIDGPVYGFVHLAGVFEDDPELGRDHDIWDRAIANNLTNGYDLATVMADRLPTDRLGRVIFVSSLAFRRGAVDQIAYSAAKGGLVGLTRALARRFRTRALVNAISPGIITTTMPARVIEKRRDRLLQEIPLGRFGEPAEVAGVVKFLLGSDASYITGQTINVDGGQVNA